MSYVVPDCTEQVSLLRSSELRGGDSATCHDSLSTSAEPTVSAN